MIEIQNITKRYGSKVAVDNATFTINKGEILGFLGRNGAGKSTTMNIITGYLSASEGRVLLDGHDILEEPREVKRHIGYLPEQPPLYFDMTVDEYLRFVCDIKNVDKRKTSAHLGEICDLVKITPVRKRLIKNLSKGYKQRVGIAQALVGNPKVIILDEPTIGLDPKQIIEIRRLIKDLGRDHTVVLSSHILPEISDVCERVVIINRGQIIAQDTLENLTHGISEISRLMLRVPGAEKDVLKTLRAVDGVKFVESIGVKEANTIDYLVESERKADVRRQLSVQLTRAGMPVLMLRPMDASLEDVFIHLTNDSEEAL